MIKLTILNMKNFLQAVNRCRDNITIIYSDGKKVNINQQYFIQNELKEQYKKNGNHLQLTLDIHNPKDYMDIIFYYIGDC